MVTNRGHWPATQVISRIALHTNQVQYEGLLYWHCITCKIIHPWTWIHEICKASNMCFVIVELQTKGLGWILAKNVVGVHLEIFLFYYSFCATSQNQNHDQYNIFLLVFVFLSFGNSPPDRNSTKGWVETGENTPTAGEFCLRVSQAFKTYDFRHAPHFRSFDRDGASQICDDIIAWVARLPRKQIRGRGNIMLLRLGLSSTVWPRAYWRASSECIYNCIVHCGECISPQ